MKVSSTVVIILITLLCVLPFVWFMLIGRKNAAKNKKIITNLLKKEDYNFTHQEFWNHNFIGIDEAKNKLVFVKVQSPDNTILMVDLNTIKSCTIDKSTLDFKRENKMESELQTLDLDLLFNSSSSMRFNLYRIEDQLSEDFEMKRAETWKQLITKAIQNNNSNLKKAS